jgi:hypothetical protein
MRAALAVAVTALAVGCSSSPTPESTPGLGAQAIQGGQLELQRSAVGLILFTDGNFCTGELIEPDVVLTAGHCVSSVEGFYTDARDAAAVGTVPGRIRHGVRKAIAHPSYVAHPMDCPNPTLDVALVLLDAKLDISPLPYAKSAADLPAVGEKLTAVGYGAHTEDAGDTTYGVKRNAIEELAEVARGSLRVVASTGLVDHGDSGGPLFRGNVVVGTASCLTDGASYGRVDAASDWIQRTIARWHP